MYDRSWALTYSYPSPPNRGKKLCYIGAFHFKSAFPIWKAFFVRYEWYGWTLLAQNVGSLNCHALPWGMHSPIFLLNFEFSLLLVCTWRHSSHVGGVFVVRKKAFLSSGNSTLFSVNCSRKNSTVLTTNTTPTWPSSHVVASQESGCCQNLSSIHLLEMNESDLGKMDSLDPDCQRQI